MARPKLEIQRERLPMRISENIMRYVRVKASVLGSSPNILIEDALEKLLEKTRTMKRMDIYGMISNPVKIKRIPISIMIRESIITEARLLAKKLEDVLFAEIVEAALQDMIHADVDAMRNGLLSKILEQALCEQPLREYLNIELQNMKIMLPGLVKQLEDAEAKQQENPLNRK